jgi:WD40 repeat protein
MENTMKNFWSIWALLIVSSSVMAELQVKKHWQHGSRVSTLAFSPDGHWLASGGTMLKIWDVTSKSWPRTLETKGKVNVLAFSPNGQWLASASDSHIELWNMTSEQLQHNLKVNKKNVIYSVSFSPDEKWLASGGEEVKLWDVTSGQLQHTLKGHGDEIYSVAFAPNGKWLASGSKDKTIKIWDVESAQLEHTLVGYQGEIYSVAFSPNGKWLASGGEGVIKLWDMTSGQLQYTWIQGWKIKSIVFSPNGAWLASANDKGNMIKIWEVESGELLHTMMNVHVEGVNSIAFSPNAKWLASGGNDHKVKLWEMRLSPVSQEPEAPANQKLDEAFDFSNLSSWFIKAVVIIVGVILLLSFIWWIIQRFSPSLRPHAPRIMVGIIVGITVGVTTTIIAYYLFDSPETATLSGVILAVAAHYLMKET